MSDKTELVYIGSIGFITSLIVDFIVIELVLKLGVFAFGKAILRIIMIACLYINFIMSFLFEIGGGTNFDYIAIAVFSWFIWSPLYYYMLMEQNFYLMSSRVKKVLWFFFIFAVIVCFSCGILLLLICFGKLSPSLIDYVHILDLMLLIILCLVEFFLIIKIYIFSKSKLKTVSPKLWIKVKFSIVVCTLCVFVDIFIITLENTGAANYAYVFKSCSFCFKIVFECLCFQFIKGIVVSIDQA
jgi:hypothetical protein